VARKVICRENVPAPAEEEVAVITPVFVAAKRGIGRLIALTQPREVAAVITPVFVAAKPGIGRLIAPTHPREEEEEEAALVTNAGRRDTCRGSVPPVAGTLALGAGKRDTESLTVPTRLKAVVGMGAARAGNAERKDILRENALQRVEMTTPAASANRRVISPAIVPTKRTTITSAATVKRKVTW